MYKSVAGVIPAVLMVIAVSVLGVTQIHERQPDSVKESLILLVVAGFVQAIAWAVTFTLSLTINTTKARNKAYLLIQAVMCLYFIASGIVWICLTVSQSGKGSKSKSVTLAMIVLFVVSVIISSVTLSINIFRMLVGIESEVLTPSSSSFGDIESFQIQPRRGMTYLQELPDFSQTRHLSGMQHHLEIIEQNTIDSIDVAGSKPVSVSKKVSEQTLVDQAPVTAQNGLSSTIIEKHISEESNKLLEYSEIINASMIAKGRGSDELNNNMDNWMDTGSKIYTKGHDIPTDPPIATTNSTSRIISLQRKASNILPLNHSRSVPLFRNAKTAPTHTNFVEVESEFKQFKNKSEVHPEEEKEDPFEYQSRRISLIKTGSENTISDIANGTSQPQNQPFNIIKEEDSTQVKRSKSTSYINQNQDRISKREERWKSIHDEKVFLLNVNECLLPSVLKSGESYIMELKRQQESFNKLETETNIPEVETDVDDDENLPYIAEFDEHENYHKDANPNEDHHEVNQFDDFTQDTRILLKKGKGYLKKKIIWKDWNKFLNLQLIKQIKRN